MEFYQGQKGVLCARQCINKISLYRNINNSKVIFEEIQTAIGHIIGGMVGYKIRIRGYIADWIFA